MEMSDISNEQVSKKMKLSRDSNVLDDGDIDGSVDQHCLANPTVKGLEVMCANTGNRDIDCDPRPISNLDKQKSPTNITTAPSVKPCSMDLFQAIDANECDVSGQICPTSVEVGYINLTERESNIFLTGVPVATTQPKESKETYFNKDLSSFKGENECDYIEKMKSGERSESNKTCEKVVKILKETADLNDDCINEALTGDESNKIFLTGSCDKMLNEMENLKPLSEKMYENSGKNTPSDQLTVKDKKSVPCKSADVYEITEQDENTEPLPQLRHSSKCVDKNNKSGSEITTMVPGQMTKLKTRIVYIYSDSYVNICDQMIRVAGRASMVHSLIEAYDLLKSLDVVAPREATVEELCQFHTSDYITLVERISQQEDEEKYDEEAEQYGLTYDCPVHVGVYDYAVLVAGATIRAAELLLGGSCDVAMNWGGGWHHAKRDMASGFCYFNDIVLGILKLREKFDRVLYVDIDLHHGDGVEEAFCTTSKVLTVSFHKHSPGFFPGTGALGDIGISKGRHYSINVPLLDGIKDAEFYAIFNRVMTRVQERFKPEAVVCQCGADGLAGDPMESFNLTPLSLARCVHALQGWKIPLLLLGGGGYNFANTAKCWAFITSIVLGRKLKQDIPDHKHLMEYGPDYELGVSVGNRKDQNSKAHLGTVYRKVMENLNHIS